MKALLIATVLFASVSSFATEALMVTSVTQRGNLMPGLLDREARIETEITFKVNSGGCTQAEDFSTRVLEYQHGFEVTIVRNNPDYCEAANHLVEIKIKTNEIAESRFGKNPIIIKNPVLVKSELLD